MVSSELGACEWFVWDLRRSGLIDRGQLDQVIGEYLKRNPRAEPPALAEYLVGQGILSAFQAERILTGKTQGLVLGPYVLMDSIGSGSMGQVYKASSKTDNQWYAVKVLPRRSMWNVRLARRQVRSFSQFSHPGVVPFVDVGTSGGLHYLVWPLVEGETLESKVQREGRLPPVVVGRMAFQIAQALTVCHQNGIFHGLIKPSNIMVGNDGQVRLLDSGIGSLLVENEGESLVDTMSTANTLTSGLDCSSPESIMEPTNRTPAGDQYSLGCVLYFALAGHYPFPEGTAVEKMMAHQSKQPKPLGEVVAGVPDSLVQVIERLMQKSPDARFSGVDELVEALHSFGPEVPAANVRPPSNFGQMKVPATRSNPEPVRSTTPIPGPGGLPLPKPAPSSPVTVGAGNAPTAYAASMPAAPSRPTAPAPIPSIPRAPLPTRQTIQNVPAAAAPVMASAVAVPTPAPAPAPMPGQKATAPGFVAEEPARAGFGLFFIFLAACLVTGLVYFLGKNFIFPQ